MKIEREVGAEEEVAESVWRVVERVEVLCEKD
jgi:hypothetical protein